MDLSYAHPEGYEPFPEVLETANELAKANGTTIDPSNDPIRAVTQADIVVTDTFVIILRLTLACLAIKLPSSLSVMGLCRQMD